MDKNRCLFHGKWILYSFANYENREGYVNSQLDKEQPASDEYARCARSDDVKKY